MTEIEKRQGSLPTVNLAEVEKKMLSLPQTHCPVSHHFGPGIYVREIRASAGSICLGHYQKTAHMNNFVSGRVLMLNPDGSQTELVAPMTFVAPPGRKVGFVLEDMVWQNIYATDETDVEKLEETYLEKSEYSEGVHAKIARIADEVLEVMRKDYQKVLVENGYTEDQVQAEVNNEDDQIPMPFGWYKTCVRPSQIHGKGFFASGVFHPGDVIAPGRINGKRTPAGRYTNHSPDPNAKPVMIGKDIVLVAIKPIDGCIAGGDGEEVTIDYRDSLTLRNFSKQEVLI